MEFILYSLILLSALIGTPIFVVMSLFAMIAFSFGGIEITAIPIEIYRIAGSPTLLTIPLFTLAGYIMAESGTPNRLLKFAQATLGFLPGGIAIVSILICAFFTAFTGASGVTIIALGGLLYPILIKEGYTEKFSLGLVTTCGSLGLLFPPSLPIILYGLVAQVDIDKIFMAGIIPGLLLIAILAAWSVYQGKKMRKLGHRKLLEDGEPAKKAFCWKTIKESVWGARWELPLPVLILAGIYGGYSTASEASAFTCAYIVVVECFLYKDLSLVKDMPRIIKESMSLVGAILLILCCALGMTNYLVDQEIPTKILEAMRSHIDSKWVFLLYLNLFLLVVGALMDIFSAIVIVVPLILPIARAYGVDPVHLAIIFLTNLEIGYITPPVGINLFISSFRFKQSVTKLYAVSVPFLILQVIALLLITYLPILSLIFVK